jgi:hypothetical protein
VADWVEETTLDRRAVARRLLLRCALLALLDAVRGITRLTRSGLSIAEWRPVTGILPPFGERAALSIGAPRPISTRSPSRVSFRSSIVSSSRGSSRIGLVGSPGDS